MNGDPYLDMDLTAALGMLFIHLVIVSPDRSASCVSPACTLYNLFACVPYFNFAVAHLCHSAYNSLSIVIDNSWNWESLPKNVTPGFRPIGGLFSLSRMFFLHKNQASKLRALDQVRHRPPSASLQSIRVVPISRGFGSA